MLLFLVAGIHEYILKRFRLIREGFKKQPSISVKGKFAVVKVLKH